MPTEKIQRNSTGKNTRKNTTRNSSIAWGVLLGLSVINVELGALTASKMLMIVVVILTLLKGHIVVNYFMGLRHCHAVWRWVMSAYLVIIGAIIAAAYLFF
jgi:hypothetical protein